MASWFRRWKIRLSGTLLIAVAFLGFAWYRHARLKAFIIFIDRHYASEIAAVEDAARNYGIPNGSQSRESLFLDKEVARNQLRDLLKNRQLVFAKWSYDGHHGASTILPDDEGMSSVDRFWATNGTGAFLYYGRSSSNQRLLVYQKWLSNAAVMKEVMLVFDEARIAKELDELNMDSSSMTR